MNWYWFLLGLMAWEFVLIGVTIWRTEKRLRALIRTMEAG